MKNFNRVNNNNNGIWLEKYSTLIMKREAIEEIELINLEGIRKLKEKEKSNYLKILETDTIKHREMKGKNRKREPQKNKKASRNQAL